MNRNKWRAIKLAYIQQWTAIGDTLDKCISEVCMYICICLYKCTYGFSAYVYVIFMYKFMNVMLCNAFLVVQMCKICAPTSKDFYITLSLTGRECLGH